MHGIFLLLLLAIEFPFFVIHAVLKQIGFLGCFACTILYIYTRDIIFAEKLKPHPRLHEKWLRRLRCNACGQCNRCEEFIEAIRCQNCEDYIRDKHP